MLSTARTVACEDNLYEQLVEAVYLQIKTSQFEFSNCLYTCPFSLDPAFVKGKKRRLTYLLKNRPVTKDCQYWSTFSLEEIATSWINPGLSAEINDLKKRYFPKSQVEKNR